MFLTQHARDQITERIPGVAPDAVAELIAKGGVTVSSGWKAAGGWQSKEFLVFWCADRPWVAILAIDTKACLTVIPAWNDEQARGAVLYEKIDKENRSIGVVQEGHIRRAIRAAGLTEIPERFQSRRYSLSARILFASQRILVCRLSRLEGGSNDVLAMMNNPELREQWRQQVLDKAAGEPIREVMLSASCAGGGLLESPLIEAPTVGGWVQ